MFSHALTLTHKKHQNCNEQGRSQKKGGGELKDIWKNQQQKQGKSGKIGRKKGKIRKKMGEKG